MNSLLKLLNSAAGITCNSLSVKPGYIFVAITGRITDGNLYALSAEKRGAIAIVSDRPACLPPLDIPVVIVKNARTALSFLADHFYHQPSKKLSVVGVTGTNGKTTITYMLKHIFSHSGLKAGLIGTVYVDVGSTTYPSTLTTPDAVTLQSYLAQMHENKVTHAAIEVSAQGIEMHRADNIFFSCGILSNICPDHLDFHNNFASYIKAKQDFINLLSPNTPLIINISDPYCQNISKIASSPVISVGFEQNADINVSINRLSTYSSDFTINISRPLTTISGQNIAPCKISFTVPLPGKHNIENAVLAAAAAIWSDVQPTKIIAALSTFKGVERRMNIFELDGITVIDDTALNPGSIDAVFSCLQKFTYRKLILINAIRGHRGSAINTTNAHTLVHWQKHMPHTLIVTASSDFVDSANEVLDEEKYAFLSILNTHGTRYTYTASLAEAISFAKQLTTSGDLLVLLGAQGMDRGWEILSNLYQKDKAKLFYHEQDQLVMEC